MTSLDGNSAHIHTHDDDIHMMDLGEEMLEKIQISVFVIVLVLVLVSLSWNHFYFYIVLVLKIISISVLLSVIEIPLCEIVCKVGLMHT